MRVVFMGTPRVAVPCLHALNDAFDVIAVYTRPDRPKGRGLHVAASEVKLAAVERDLEVRQPRTLRGGAEALADLRPDVVAVVAYGALLPPEILEVPVHGCVNVHFSLLPRWRGAAPVERAIQAGDSETGVTTMLMDEGLDTGPVLLQETVPIAPDETSGSLREKLATVAPQLLVRTLGDLASGDLRAHPQPEHGVTYAEKIEADDAELDLDASAAVAERTVRALDPSPGAHVWFRGKRLKVWRAEVVPGVDGAETATVVMPQGGLAIQSSDAALALLEVQPEGKRRISDADFVRGYRPAPGERIGRPR